MFLQLGIIKCFSRKHHKCVPKYNLVNALHDSLRSPCSGRSCGSCDSLHDSLMTAYLVLVAKPPSATTREFRSHLSPCVWSLLVTALNLQYWDEESTCTPTSSTPGSSPETITLCQSETHGLINKCHFFFFEGIS